jgi:hypothetical protein
MSSGCIWVSLPYFRSHETKITQWSDPRLQPNDPQHRSRKGAVVFHYFVFIFLRQDAAGMGVCA